MYCGNNRLHPSVVNGDVQIGTRHGCLKTGIGRGLHLPYNSDYAGPYDPIDATKKYCGNEVALPDGYDRFGSNTECLNIGIGIGMTKRAQLGPGTSLKKLAPYGAAMAVGLAGIFLALFFIKPSFVMKKDSKGNTTNKYDWVQFIGLWLIGVVVWFLAVYLVRYLVNRR